MARDQAPAYVAGIRVLLRAKVSSFGSGFLISPRHIVTCLHVVLAGTQKYENTLTRGSLDEPLPSALQSGLENIEIEVNVGLNERHRRTARRAALVFEDVYADIAVLELEKPVIGIAPPQFHPGDHIDETPVAFRMDNSFVARTELPKIKENAARHYGRQAKAGPVMIQHDHTAMAGNSGGPIIVEVKGAHQLIGMATLGGLGYPTGVMTTASRIADFLKANEVLALHAPLADAGDAAEELAPGVAPYVEIDIPGTEPIVFRGFSRSNGTVLFRAIKPMSSQSVRFLTGQQSIAGAPLLPANVRSAAEATQLIDAVGHATGVSMRLPRIEEVDDLRRRFGAASVPIHFGMPVTLEQFGHPGGPPAFAEWIIGSRDQPVIALCDETGLRLADKPCIRQDTFAPPHPRVGVQPVLALE